MNDQFEIFDDVNNPLDSIEAILNNQDWVFNRTQEDELSVHISGHNSQYQLIFTWQEEYSAMKLRCEYDLHFSETRMDVVTSAIQNINTKLPLGHFVISKENMAPCFSYTSLLRGCIYASDMKHLEDLIEHALTECEQHYALFNLLAHSDIMNDNILNFALMDSAGAA